MSGTAATNGNLGYVGLNPAEGGYDPDDVRYSRTMKVPVEYSKDPRIGPPQGGLGLCEHTDSRPAALVDETIRVGHRGVAAGASRINQPHQAVYWRQCRSGSTSLYGCCRMILLDDMGQFVRQQTATGIRVRLILPGTEYDIVF